MDEIKNEEFEEFRYDYADWRYEKLQEALSEELEQFVEKPRNRQERED